MHHGFLAEGMESQMCIVQQGGRFSVIPNWAQIRADRPSDRENLNSPLITNEATELLHCLCVTAAPCHQTNYLPRCANQLSLRNGRPFRRKENSQCSKNYQRTAMQNSRSTTLSRRSLVAALPQLGSGFVARFLETIWVSFAGKQVFVSRTARQRV